MNSCWGRLLHIGLAILFIIGTLMPQPALAGAEQFDVPLGTGYYQDAQGIQQKVNNEFTPAVTPWDWQMLDAGYHIRVKEDFTAGQILEFEVDNSTVQFQPMALEWTNDLGQIQSIAMPNDVAPTITNPPSEVLPDSLDGTITWENGYGFGRHFEWECTPVRLNKTLKIDSFADLPVSQQYILDGENPALRLNLVFAPSQDVDIFVDGSLWNRTTKVQTFNIIEFRKDGGVLWNFEPLMYWGSNPQLEDNEGQSVATLEKRGNKLYISVRVPYDWLQTAIYPVFIDADVTIDANIYTITHFVASRGGVFWTSPTVGYVIYVDANTDLKYNKTLDGGATWGGTVNIRTGNIIAFDCWADWQTEGDTGTKIHIAYVDRDTNDIRYVYLETSGDSVGGDDLIEACQGSGTFPVSSARSERYISITKSRGGNLAVALRYRDNTATAFFSFYTSPDGDTWTSEASPWEGQLGDFILLFPGNEADNQDLWATFWDADTSEISLKTYDDSGNSWSEQLISGSMTVHGIYLQMDGAIRLSDGHLIFAAWSQYDNAASDLMVWDINGAGSITAKTNVITDTSEYFLVSVFINQANDDIYIAYVGGNAAQSQVAAQYQLSQDGAGSWDGEIQIQANADDDERWISCGAVKAVWGGKFQPVWFNDDINDLFCNTDNGISIGGIVLATVTTQAATDVEETTATGNGNITNTGGENCDRRGIVWDLASHGDPGNVAPSASGYANDVGTDGAFGTGAFTESLTGLPINDVIYCRAYAHNSAGYAYGSEVSFLTKPVAPTQVVTGIVDTGTNTGLVFIGLGALILLSVLAFWKPMSPLFMIMAGIAMMMGLAWYDIFTNEMGMAFSLGLISYSLVCVGYTFRVIFWQGGGE